MACRKCFDGCARVQDGAWRLIHNPGYWGSSVPTTLVLGFSKGQTQNSAAISAPFDAVAFSGMRSRLAAALVAVGVMHPDRALDPDSLFRADATEFGFASLIRCSLLMRDKDAWVGTGRILPRAAGSRWAGEVITSCIQQHLSPLPASTSRVLLLGTTAVYVSAVTSVIARLYADFHQINPVAFRAGGVVWAFVSHPSGANGHFDAWLTDDPSSSLGQKREWARLALSGRSDPPQARSVTVKREKSRTGSSLSKAASDKGNKMKKLLHANPEARSKLVERAEKYLYDNLELISSTAKVAGFRLAGGRELLLLRGGNTLRVVTKPLPLSAGLDAPRLYPPTAPRNSNFKSCAPTLAEGFPAAQWTLQDFDQLPRLLKAANGKAVTR
jgi:hypothetical protein